jgi:hypothetical protein
MKNKLLSLAVVIVTASIIFGCNSKGINTSDAVSLINGPNSIKGTITGTMLDNTAYSFPYDYHYTTNDGNSSSESWIEDGGTFDGDTIIEVWQYFYFDRNGYDDYGDNWSASGKYFYFYFYFDAKSMKQMPTTYTSHYCEGMWQNITTTGNRFVYATYFNTNYSNPGTMDVTNLKYDKGSEILSGKMVISMPDGNGNQNWYNNHKATTITGDFRVYVAKENFQVTNKGTYYGQVYRKRNK